MEVVLFLCKLNLLCQWSINLLLQLCLQLHGHIPSRWLIDWASHTTHPPHTHTHTHTTHPYHTPTHTSHTHHTPTTHLLCGLQAVVSSTEDTADDHELLCTEGDFRSLLTKGTQTELAGAPSRDPRSNQRWWLTPWESGGSCVLTWGGRVRGSGGRTHGGTFGRAL